MIPPPTQLVTTKGCGNGEDQEKLNEVNRITNQEFLRIVPEIAQAHGLNCIDLCTPILNHPNRESLLPDDLHFNEEGHEVLAQAIFENA